MSDVILQFLLGAICTFVLIGLVAVAITLCIIGIYEGIIWIKRR